MDYDYLKAVTDDVKEYIENEIDIEEYGDDAENVYMKSYGLMTV